ncbi:MAG: hypothetical protein RL757_2726 [Bacteroidota bacterium]|jgi:hypothetical protein
MEKYMLVFHSTPLADEVYAMMSPEDMQTELAKWGAWIGGIAEQGKFIASDALDNNGKTVKGSKKVVTDGPFTEGKELVSGYLILQADSIDEAVELSYGCPIYDHDGTLEVRKIQVY